MKTTDKITFNGWDKDHPPEKILIIRLHAIGDTAITLPACAGLRNLLPDSEIDFLTSKTSYGLINSVGIFNNVYELPMYTGRTTLIGKLLSKLRTLKQAITLGNNLKKKQFDVIIDLQHNRNSFIIRKLCNVKFWSELDRYSPKSASTRMLETIHNAGFTEVKIHFKQHIRTWLISKAKEILLNNGWNGNENLIVLNPAGLWFTRKWPIDNYVSLAGLISKKYHVKYLLLGDERILESSKYLSDKLGGQLINLACKTSLEIAFTILSLCSLIISEDSALYHMAWALGIPSVLLLGSTRSDWTYHKSDHALCLNSDDLPCGNCMQPECRFGDVHCLTRYTPEIVFEKARALLSG